MIHPVARRLLPRLLDGDLPARRRAAVLRHLERCPRCRRVRAEYELSENLLRRLPAALLPREPTPEAEERLRALARWGATGQRPLPGGWPARGPQPAAAAFRRPARENGGASRSWSLPALGTAVAAGLLALVLSVVPPSPGPAGDPGRFELAPASLQDLYLMPGHIR